MTMNLSESDVDSVIRVNEIAAKIGNRDAFEASLLPEIRDCFRLSVSTLCNRPESIAGSSGHVVACGEQPDIAATYNLHRSRHIKSYRRRLAFERPLTPQKIIALQHELDGDDHAYDFDDEFRRPQGMDVALAMILEANDERRVMLGFWRDREDKPFDDIDLAKFRMIAPSLSGAYARVQDNAQHRQFAWMFDWMQDSGVDSPILLLDENHTITFANAPATDIISAVSPSQKNLGIPHDLRDPICRLCDATAERTDAEEALQEQLRIGEKDWLVTVASIPSEFGAGFVLRFGGDKAGDPFEHLRNQGLTSRELEVVRSAAKGLSSKEVARELGISYFTVQDHLKSIYRKLNVQSRVNLTNILHAQL